MLITWILDCSNRIGDSSSKFNPKSLVSLTDVTIFDGPVEPNGKWFSCVNKCWIMNRAAKWIWWASLDSLDLNVLQMWMINLKLFRRSVPLSLSLSFSSGMLMHHSSKANMFEIIAFSYSSDTIGDFEFINFTRHWFSSYE